MWFFFFIIAVAFAMGWLVYRWLSARFSEQVKGLKKSVLTCPHHSARRRPDIPEPLRTQSQQAAARLPDETGAIRFRQKGMMRLGPDKPWKSFEAEQIIALDNTAFVWTARTPLVFGAHLQIIDAYDGSIGLLAVRINGAIPLATKTGGDLDCGEVQRYLAELPWAQSAISRNKKLRFEEQCDGRILAYTADLDRECSVTLTLNDEGQIGQIETKARPRTVGSKTVLTPWRGRFSNWMEIGGLFVPAKGEVSWLIDGEPFTYWRGEIVSIEALDKNGNPL